MGCHRYVRALTYPPLQGNVGAGICAGGPIDLRRNGKRHVE